MVGNEGSFIPIITHGKASFLHSLLFGSASQKVRLRAMFLSFCPSGFPGRPFRSLRVSRINTVISEDVFGVFRRGPDNATGDSGFEPTKTNENGIR